MSAHAEAAHGHEVTDNELNESALETLLDGIRKIGKSVRIALKKLYHGFINIFKSNDHGHGDESHAAETADAHADHDEKKADTGEGDHDHTPAAAEAHAPAHH